MTMDVKQLVLEFQHSGKITSQPIIGSNLPSHVEAFKGEERAAMTNLKKNNLL